MPALTQQQLHEVYFVERFPELHHYTTFDGMAGIAASQTLWATHYGALNDSTEVIGLKPHLESAFRKRVLPMLQRMQQRRASLEKKVRKFGGVKTVSDDLAGSFIASIYQVLLETPPYFVSFCSHHEDKPYEKENGLLSQWRGYGGAGGFALVFDTQALVKMLQREADAHYYVQMNIAEVSYDVADKRMAGFINSTVEGSEDMLRGILTKNERPMDPQAFISLVAATSLLKHQGFREEREVRIAAVPANEKLLKQMIEENTNFKSQPLKTTISESPERIALFEKLEQQRLPITRIIVGPGTNQKKNAEAADGFFGGRVSIVVGNSIPQSRLKVRGLIRNLPVPYLEEGDMSRSQILTAILPCNDLDASEAFYARLGFTHREGDGDYRMLSNDNGGELHLTAAVEGWLIPGRNPFGLYLYIENVDEVAARMNQIAEDKPWGMYEFALSDPDETLVRIGWPSRLRV